jgi:hypothetical protein
MLVSVDVLSSLRSSNVPSSSNRDSGNSCFEKHLLLRFAGDGGCSSTDSERLRIGSWEMNGPDLRLLLLDLGSPEFPNSLLMLNEVNVWCEESRRYGR